VALETLGLLVKGSKVLKMIKVIKMMNVSGAGWGIIFTLVLSAGRQSPEPAAPDQALLGVGDALGLACRVEGVLADPFGGGLPA
jgi:hypothetical protein